MRIFQICADSGIPFDGTKGASVHLRDLADALARQGNELHVFVADPGSGQTSDQPFDVQRLESDSLQMTASAAGRPAFVYERYSLGHTRGLEWARRLAVPFVLEVNAPLVEEAARHRPATLYPGDDHTERRLLRRADVVVAVSERLREYAADIRGSDGGTVVVRNGCDPRRFGSPADLDGSGPQTLVFLGHPKPWHGADELPQLLADLGQRGLEPKLLLIGGGEGVDRVIELAKGLGVAGQIEITGPLAPVAAARRLQEGTVAVAPFPPHPSFYFCPLKVVDYMAAGLPVVTTAQGDVPEILGAGGIAVPPADRLAFVNAVETLLTDQRLRRRLGAVARERALSEFTWDNSAARIISAAEEMAAVRGRAA